MVKLVTRNGDDTVRALTSFAGKLYVGAGRHFFRIDPKTSNRRSFRSPAGGRVYGWLAATARRLAADGVTRRGAVIGSVLQRRSGALVRSVPSPSEQLGFGSGWVAYGHRGAGPIGYSANGKRRWRTLRGVATNGVSHIRRYLYALAGDGEIVNGLGDFGDQNDT